MLSRVFSKIIIQQLIILFQCLAISHKSERLDEEVGGVGHVGGDPVPWVVVVLKTDLFDEHKYLLLNLFIEVDSAKFQVDHEGIGLGSLPAMETGEDFPHIHNHL